MKNYKGFKNKNFVLYKHTNLIEKNIIIIIQISILILPLFPNDLPIQQNVSD